MRAILGFRISIATAVGYYTSVYIHLSLLFKIIVTLKDSIGNCVPTAEILMMS